MINRLLPCLWIGALLVSCDKQRNADSDSNANSPEATRASRAAHQDLPGRQRDLRAGLADAKKLTSPEERDKALLAVARDALEINPNIVAEILKYMSPDSPAKAALIKEMIARLLQNDPDAVATWVASLDSEKDRAVGRGAIAANEATTDPAHAAQMLMDSGVTGLEFDRVAVRVMKQWVAQAPTDAVAWGLALPEGESRSTAVRTAVGQWVQVDTKAASAWLTNPDNAAVRKETTQYMAEALASHPIGEMLLQDADPAMRAELEQQMVQITGKPITAGLPPGMRQPVPRAVPQPEPAADPQSDPQTQPQPDPQADPQPQPKPVEPQMEPGAEPDPEPEAEPEQPQPKPKAKVKPKVSTKPTRRP